MAGSVYRHGEDSSTLQERVLSDMEFGVELPPKGEPVISACYAGYLATRHIPEVANQLDEYVATLPPDIPQSLVTRKYFKRHQAILTEPQMRAQTLYPYGADEMDFWVEYFSHYHSSPASPYARRLRQILPLPLQTNRPERRVVLGFVLAAHQISHNFHKRPIVHDYGAGANLVLESLDINSGPIEVTMVDSEGQEIRRQSEIFKVMSKLSNFEKGYGIEQHPPKTEEDLQMIKSDTLEPSQYDMYAGPRAVGKGYEEQFDYLLMLHTVPSMVKDRVQTIEGDFRHLSREKAEFLRQNPATVAFLGHVLASSPGLVDRSIKAILPYMDPDGYIVINEYATIDPRNKKRLRILKHWYNDVGQCNTFALRVRNLDEGFLHLFTWDTSELHRGRAGRDLTKLSRDLILDDSA